MYLVMINTGTATILATSTGPVDEGNEVAYKLTEDSPEAIGVVTADRYVISLDDEETKFIMEVYGDERKVARITARYDRYDFE